MIFFKSYRRLFPKLFEYRDEVESRKRKNILQELERRSLKETADYVEAHMVAASACSSHAEVYDCALSKISIPAGLYCEFGVWKATSINYIAGKINGTIHGFDSFEGLPEFWRGGYGKSAFSLEGNLPPVAANVRLHKGWFEDTLPAFVEEHPGPLAFLHVDCDLYSSTKTIFSFLGNRIQPGTVIVFDEYFNFPLWKQHEYKAFQEFLEAYGLSYQYLCYNQFHEQVAVQIREKC